MTDCNTWESLNSSLHGTPVHDFLTSLLTPSNRWRSRVPNLRGGAPGAKTVTYIWRSQGRDCNVATVWRHHRVLCHNYQASLRFAALGNRVNQWTSSDRVLYSNIILGGACTYSYQRGQSLCFPLGHSCIHFPTLVPIPSRSKLLCLHRMWTNYKLDLCLEDLPPVNPQASDNTVIVRCDLITGCMCSC